MKEEKAYVVNKEQYMKVFLKYLAVFVGFSLFLGLMGSKENSMLSVESIIIALIFTLICFGLSDIVQKNKVFINEEYIGFQALFYKDIHSKYQWQSIDMIIIGDVEVKSARMPYTIFGFEIIYIEQQGSSNSSKSDVFPLKQFADYELLIADIKNMCEINHIKCRDLREN